MVVDSWWAAVGTLVVAGALLTMIVAAERALATISRGRLADLEEAGHAGAAAALRLIERAGRTQEVLSLAKLLLVSLFVITTFIVADGRILRALLLSIGTLLTLQTVAGAAGRRLFHPLALGLARPLSWLVTALGPLASLLAAVGRRLGSTAAQGEIERRSSEEEQRTLVRLAGNGATEISEERREMISSVVELAGTTVREVMVPRPDVVALREDMTMLEALDLIIREGHSRIPVYRDGVDNIIGVLYAKDLLAYLRDGRTDTAIQDMLRPALFVPESRMADELLHDLQRRRVHLAIVFDEYGGTAGLVTIEDILEEIVGEIQDEYDAEERAFVPVTENEAIVSSRLDIDDLNREMGLALPTDENDTVGGLIYSALGRVPLVGDAVQMEEAGVTFRVLAMVGRRIASVRVIVSRPGEPAESEGVPVDAAAETGRGSPAAEDGPEMGVNGQW